MNIDATAVFTVLISVAGSIFLGRMQNRNFKVDIEEKYRKMLNEEIDARSELMGRFEKLEDENRKLRHAFTRAIAYIRVNLPGQEVPDFFIETGEVGKGD